MSQVDSDINALMVSFIANVNVNENKAKDIALQFTELIASKKIKLLDVIISLKDRFISDDDLERMKALACLSSILSNLSPEQLLKNDINVIFNFYMSKFEDSVLLKECLLGFSSLMSMKYISIDETAKLLDSLQRDYDSTKNLAPVRYFPFVILDNVYSKWSDKLIENKNFSDLFIKTYIHVASGEKDPKNLLISFKLNKIIASKLPNASNYKQKLFDILFSYFPITFKPPKDDPYKISNADLKLALRSAISASDIFAEDAFSNLIDKLSATSPVIKNDTLLTIMACINKFSGKACLPVWLQVWNALKFEIMHSDDGAESTFLDPILQNDGVFVVKQNTENNYLVALDVMKWLGLKLAKLSEAAFNKYISHIVEELTPNFTYTKDLRQSCHVLASIGSGNLMTFNKVIDLTLPLFLENTTEISKLKLMLLNLSFFLDSYIQLSTELTSNEIQYKKFIEENHLDDHKDEILMILSMALTGNSKIEVTVRTLSIIQFTKLIRMKEYLTKEEISLIIQYITETILTDTNKNIYCACLEGLKVISQSYEDTVYEVSLKDLLNLLPTNFFDIVHYHNHEEIIQVDVILKIILDFTTSRHRLIKESVIALSNTLFEIYDTCSEGSVEYCFLLLSTIYSLFENNFDSMNEIDALKVKEAVEPSLFKILRNDDISNAVLNDDQNLSLLSNVLFFFNIKYNLKEHQVELNRYNKLFLEEYGILNKPSRMILPYVKILCALDKASTFENINSVFEQIISLLKDSNSNNMSSLEKIGYMEILMCLTNKWVNGDAEKLIIEKYVNYSDESIINLEIIAWIGKGLVMKNSPISDSILSHYMVLLKDDKVGVIVSKLFELYVIDINSMSKHKGVTWNNNVKLLYKQKFFNDVFQKLVTSYRESELSLAIKCNYLTALSLILKHTPSKLVEQFMNELLPMLLQALEMPNTEVRISALDTLRDTTDKFGLLITENIDVLIPLLLELVIPGSRYNNVTVRLLALQLLKLLAYAIPLNHCMPYKDQVINGLLLSLSDKKRIVRKQCIDTRQVYYELGQVPFE